MAQAKLLQGLSEAKLQIYFVHWKKCSRIYYVSSLKNLSVHKKSFHFT